MPDKTGSQTAIQIRHLYETSGLQVPFICCATAEPEASFKKNAKEIGLDAFISKPIKQDQIKQLL